SSVHALFFILLFLISSSHCDLFSFPTRRSSDLRYVRLYVDGYDLNPGSWQSVSVYEFQVYENEIPNELLTEENYNLEGTAEASEDRKSTRLNSSHVSISYAVFCLKQKNTEKNYL